MPSPFRKLAALTAGEWRDLLRAQRAVLRAERRVRREAIGSLAIREPWDPAAAVGDPRRAQALALAVGRVATYGLSRPACLARTIALRELLLEDGIDGASIRIGVRRHRGTFQAHAWVRWGDHILGDHADHIATFTEVDDLRVMESA